MLKSSRNRTYRSVFPTKNIRLARAVRLSPLCIRFESSFVCVKILTLIGEFANVFTLRRSLACYVVMREKILSESDIASEISQSANVRRIP